MCLPYEPGIVLHTKTCTEMFIAALFEIAKNQKQPSCPSTGQWLNTLWCTHPMEDYSAIKNDEPLILIPTCMDLMGIMLSEKRPISNGYILYDSIYITF